MHFLLAILQILWGNSLRVGPRFQIRQNRDRWSVAVRTSGAHLEFGWMSVCPNLVVGRNDATKATYLNPILDRTLPWREHCAKWPGERGWGGYSSTTFLTGHDATEFESTPFRACGAAS